jgi:hypothetical protein
MSKSEKDIRLEYRNAAVVFLNGAAQNMNGSGALVWFRGALELAEALGVLTKEEVSKYDAYGKAQYEAAQAAARAEREAILAQRQAERAEKAKAARGK